MMSGGFGFAIPGLGMVVFWGLIVFLVVWLVRGASGEPDNRVGKTASEILDARFARGEIDRDEYEDMKKALR